MKKNIGTTDRLIRLAMAILLFLLAYWRSSWVLLLAGIFVFCEALFSWCIVYQFLGKNSCPRK
ncbi:MAG TPA: DUF2892 domain-containing protein [Chlamydiales bacterium]|nr:DUF2892 domain-containing protein [Chlamydiales bacterium]